MKINSSFTYLKKILIVFLGTFLGALSSFFIQILLARNLSVEDYGIFNTYITFLNFLSPCIGLGLSSYWLKVYGEDKEMAKNYMPSSLKLISITTLLVFFIVFFYSVFNKHIPFLISLTLIFYCFGQSVIELIGSKFQLNFKYTEFSLVQALPHVFRLIVVLIVILLDYSSLDNFFISYCVAGLSLIIIFGKGLRSFLKIKPDFKKKSYISLKYLLSKSFPFWLAGFLYLVYMQSCVLMLSYFHGGEATGYFNAAFLIISSIYLIPSIFYQKLLLPKLHKWAYHDKRKLMHVYALGNKYMFFIGLFICFLILLYSNFIVFNLYGTKYVDSISILNILALAIPFKFLSSSIGAFLSTRDFMSGKVKIMLLVSIINVIINLLIIPVLSFKGAAVAVVITEIIMMVFLIYFFNTKCKKVFYES